MQKILAKLHSIMGEVDYIQKDKTNSFQNYRYASEAAIKEKLHAALVKHKVLFTLSLTDAQNETVTTSKGNIEARTIVKCEYALIDIESGEKLEGKFIGFGNDPGDKGIYKAITGAIKYILTSTFLIPTGDDPEDDDEPKKTKTALKDHGLIEEPFANDEPAYVPDASFKTCPKCNKQHKGKYDRCYTCWKADQNK